MRRRDGYRCQRCGRHRDELRPRERLEVHIDPRFRGDHRYVTDADCITVCAPICHGILGRQARPQKPKKARKRLFASREW